MEVQTNFQKPFESWSKVQTGAAALQSVMKLLSLFVFDQSVS